MYSAVPIQLSLLSEVKPLSIDTVLLVAFGLHYFRFPMLLQKSTYTTGLYGSALSGKEQCRERLEVNRHILIPKRPDS